MMGARAMLLMGVSGLALSGCSTTSLPAAVDTRNDSCAHCRMMVSDVRFAGQIVAPGEEPRFFDDIGCLRSFLDRSPALPPGVVVYVADHRTKRWVDAATAVYVRNERVQTPMASHLLSFADAASRDADPEGRGTRLDAADVYGPAVPASGKGGQR